jgi:hypothetical protein
MYQPQTEALQKINKEIVDATLKTVTSVTKAIQSATAEVTDNAKQQSESVSVLTQKLLSAKTPERFLELYSDFAQNNYQNFVAQATKIGEIYSNLTKEAMKPFETAMAIYKRTLCMQVQSVFYFLGCIPTCISFAGLVITERNMRVIGITSVLC